MKKQKSRRGGFTFWEVVIVMSILVVLVALLFPLFGRSHPISKRSSCQSNLKQIGLGFKQYIQDWDEKYPPLANSKPNFGWADSLQPYLKSTQILQCNVETTPPNADPTTSGYTDYWFNARMAGASEQSLDAQALTVAMGDGDSSNARYHLWGIPRNWMGSTASPLYRHTDGANYAFADGHVRWFKNDIWKDSLDTKNGSSTFRLKPMN